MTSMAPAAATASDAAVLTEDATLRAPESSSSSSVAAAAALFGRMRLSVGSEPEAESDSEADSLSEEEEEVSSSLGASWEAKGEGHVQSAAARQD